MNMKHKLQVAKQKGYTTDKKGNIISPKGEKLFIRRHKSEYKFTIRVDDDRVTITVHKYVGYLKYGDLIFSPNVVVLHKNGDVADNSWENISYGSRSDAMMNLSEDFRNERANKAAAAQRKFSDEVIVEMGRLKKIGLSLSEIADKFNTSKSSVSYLLTKSTSGRKALQKANLIDI
jgi:hypothetical protein